MENMNLIGGVLPRILLMYNNFKVHSATGLPPKEARKRKIYRKLLITMKSIE
jgi:hypothetical protein